MNRKQLLELREDVEEIYFRRVSLGSHNPDAEDITRITMTLAALVSHVLDQQPRKKSTAHAKKRPVKS